MMEENGPSRSVQHHYYTCFWPPGPHGVLFCGTALIAIGTGWLASNLGWLTEDWWDVVLPVLLAGWGVAILLSTRSRGTGR